MHVGVRASRRPPGPNAAACILLAFVLTVSPGCMQKDSSTERSLELAPGGFAELRVYLAIGEGVAWDWHANATIDFNIHTHDDDSVQTLVKTRSLADEGELLAESAGEYWLMWANPNTDVTKIEVSVIGGDLRWLGN